MKNERYLKDHMIHSAGQRFKCDLCGKIFRWPNGLLKHKKFHSDIMPFHVMSVITHSKRKQHYKTIILFPIRIYILNVKNCARTFSFQSALNKHYIRVHKFKKEGLNKSKLKEMWLKNIYLKMIVLIKLAKIYFYVYSILVFKYFSVEIQNFFQMKMKLWN